MVWMMGQSAPSAYLLMTQNWEEWWIHQMVVLHSERTQQAEEMGQQESPEIQQREM